MRIAPRSIHTPRITDNPPSSMIVPEMITMADRV